MSEPFSIADKVVLITGANTGIGAETAKALAAKGAELYLAGRSLERTQPVIDAIVASGAKHKPHFLALDLADLDSVRACAKAFLDEGRPLHVLINNAGIAGMRGKSKAGFEITFAVNHLGHFLLTQLLLDCLKASAPSRVVNVASRAHFNAKTLDFDTLEETTGTVTWPEYARSKLCNVLFTRALHRRLEGTGVTTYALHPGVIASDIWRRIPWPIRPLMTLFMTSTEDGAKTSVFCASAPEAEKDAGAYFDNCKAKWPSRLAQDEALGEKLWQVSESLIAKAS